MENKNYIKTKKDNSQKVRVLTICLPGELFDKLKGLKKSELIQDLLREYFSRVESEDKKAS